MRLPVMLGAGLLLAVTLALPAPRASAQTTATPTTRTTATDTAPTTPATPQPVPTGVGVTKNADGNPVLNIPMGDGNTYTTYRFTDGGQMVTTMNPDGTRGPTYEADKNPDGSFTVTVTYPDGTVSSSDYEDGPDGMKPKKPTPSTTTPKKSGPKIYVKDREEGFEGGVASSF